MSKENTQYDVRFSLYNTSKGKCGNITFFNDTELLLDCTRVKMVRDEDRLYFHKGDSVKRSIKISGDYSNVLQFYSGYETLKDMEGLYDIKYDSSLDLYYIDKQERLGDCTYMKGHLGTKQLHHNPGIRGKKGGNAVTVALKDNAKKIVEDNKKQKKEDATNVVIKALLQLLRVQIQDCEEALATLDALEKYIV